MSALNKHRKILLLWNHAPASEHECSLFLSITNMIWDYWQFEKKIKAKQAQTHESYLAKNFSCPTSSIHWHPWDRWHFLTCPGGTVSLANGHSPWMLGTFHCSLYSAGGRKLSVFLMYIPKEGMTKKIRKEMDEVFFFSPLPEVSSPILLGLLHGPHREDMTVSKKLYPLSKETTN